MKVYTHIFLYLGFFFEYIKVEKCFKQNLYGRMRHILYEQYIHCVNLKIFYFTLQESSQVYTFDNNFLLNINEISRNILF